MGVVLGVKSRADTNHSLVSVDAGVKKVGKVSSVSVKCCGPDDWAWMKQCSPMDVIHLQYVTEEGGLA